MKKEVEVCPRQEAIDTAWDFAESVYKKNTIPMKKSKFIELSDMVYLVAVSNTTKDIYNYIKSNPEADFDVILGDLHLIMKKAWNNMLDNPIGKATIKKMEIEDIMADKHQTFLLKKR